MKKKMAMLLMAAMCMSLFAGCSSNQEQKADAEGESSQEAAASEEKETKEDSADGKITIGVIPQDPSVEFYTKMVEGYQDGGAEVGAEISVQYSKNDVSEETRLTEAYISQGASGVIINPIDSVAIAGPIQKALAQNVPIVLTDVTPEEELDCASIVTSDNYAGGKAAGEMMIDMIGQGKIVMTKFKYSSIAMDDRYQGFEDALEGSNLDIVDTVEVDGTREDTLTKITPMLTKYPDLAGIFCSQGDPAIGCLAAVEAAKMEESVTIISYDVESEVAEAIKEGSAIRGGVTQFPYVMGYEAVRQMAKAIAGEPCEELIELPVIPVTQENVQELLDDSVEFLKNYGDYDLAAGK